ncbi:MAG: hypothetical protein OEZ38_08760 [Gammaproteobacteria bacterium]|nr:hypothetical protein [Gammaproteobacteria bacterium]
MRNGTLLLTLILVSTFVTGCKSENKIRELYESVFSPNNAETLEFLVMSDYGGEHGVKDVSILIIQHHTNNSNTCDAIYELTTDRKGYAQIVIKSKTPYSVIIYKQDWIIDEYKTLLAHIKSFQNNDLNNGGTHEFWIKRSSFDRAKEQLNYLLDISNKLSPCLDAKMQYDLTKKWDKQLYLEALSVERQIHLLYSTSFGSDKSIFHIYGKNHNPITSLRNRRLKNLFYPSSISEEMLLSYINMKRLAQVGEILDNAIALELERSLLNNDSDKYLHIIRTSGEHKISEYLSETDCSILGAALLADIYYENGRVSYIYENTFHSKSRLRKYNLKVFSFLVQNGYRFPNDVGDYECDMYAISIIMGLEKKKHDKEISSLLSQAGLDESYYLHINSTSSANKISIENNSGISLTR